jgi:hypothetical protein
MSSCTFTCLMEQSHDLSFPIFALNPAFAPSSHTFIPPVFLARALVVLPRYVVGPEPVQRALLGMFLCMTTS